MRTVVDYHYIRSSLPLQHMHRNIEKETRKTDRFIILFSSAFERNQY